MILASADLSQYTRVADNRQTTDFERLQLIPVEELAMQLQRSPNDNSNNNNNNNDNCQFISAS